MKNDERFQQFLQRVADGYRGEGYEVTINPPQESRPGFLQQFEPDLIAVRQGENVVVGISRWDTSGSTKDLGGMASAVGRQPGWRFDVVLYRPVESRQFGIAAPRSIRKTLSDSERLFEEGQRSAAFMLAWSALEAAGRRALVRDIDESLGKRSSLDLIKNLAFHGFITDDQYYELVALDDVRNGLAHGALALSIGAKEFRKLTGLVHDLLDVRETEPA